MWMDHLSSNTVAALATASLIIVGFLFLRLVPILKHIQNERRMTSTPTSTSLSLSTNNITSNNTPSSNHKIKTMIVLGSGGHTTEMIHLLQELDPGRYAPVMYVVANSDTTSIPRLQKYIQRQDDMQKILWKGRYPAESSGENGAAAVHRLPRAREVHQSYGTSIVTTCHSILRTLLLLWNVRPELILANGPGTCVPVVYSAFLFRLLFGSSNSSSGGNPSSSHRWCWRCKVIFVESLCRVRTLSLSGKLVYPMVDRFVVHWPYLKREYPMVEVCDVLVRHDGQ